MKTPAKEYKLSFIEQAVFDALHAKEGELPSGPWIAEEVQKQIGGTRRSRAIITSYDNS